MTYVFRRRVEWADVDPLGIYRHTALLSYVGEAEVELMRAAEVFEILVPRLPRTFINVSFISSARLGEDVDIDVGIGRIGRSSLQFDFDAETSGRRLAHGTVGTAFIDGDGRSTPVPDVVRERLAPYLTARAADHQEPSVS